MKALANLTRSHLRRALTLKAGIDAMEKELCRILGVPDSLVRLRDRARMKLMPAALRRQIEAAEESRLAAGGGFIFRSPFLEAHLRMRDKARSKAGALAKRGWKKVRGSARNSRRPEPSR
jgi:hypothetical protein